eukprot:gene17606-23180_t
MSTVMTSEEMLASILKALEGKTVLEAPRVSRETIVSTLKEHTKLIQEIKSAVRRQVEQLTSDVESITTELQDKVDKDSVNIIVHEKYDDIVKYLQDALQSSQEDEQNFKLKADELQELLLKLANSKCDRTEIAPMQEISGNVLSFNPDDMNYDRMVLGKGGSGRSTTITLPTDQRPGSFRIASEAGKPGGKAASPKNPFLETILDNKHENLSQSNITLVPIPLHQQDLQLPSPKGTSMNQGQDMSFLGAPTVGSGYNLKSGQMVKTKPLKSSSGFADNTQDLEAGFLVKGQDGKFYYTDEEPMSDSPVASVPTSKKINLKPKLQ